MEENIGDVCYLEVRRRPFSDLTIPRETQSLIDGMMDVANLREQMKKLKMAISRKKVKELYNLVTEVSKGIVDKIELKNECNEKIELLSTRYKELKEDFSIRRSTFETTITAIEVKVASLKMESDTLRKNPEVYGFIEEYCQIRSDIERLKERKLNAQGETREAIQKDIDSKILSLEGCLEEAKKKESVQKFLDCNDKINAQGRLIKDNKESLAKLNSMEDELDSKFQDDIECVRQELRNQRALVSSESSQSGIKKLLNIIKQKLGINKVQEKEESCAYEMIIKSVNETTAYFDTSATVYISEVKVEQNQGIDKITEESQTIARSGLSSAKIVNTLADWFREHGKTESTKEDKDYGSGMSETPYLIEQVV